MDFTGVMSFHTWAGNEKRKTVATGINVESQKALGVGNGGRRIAVGMDEVISFYSFSILWPVAML